jgi:uncharacterized protein
MAESIAAGSRPVPAPDPGACKRDPGRPHTWNLALAHDCNLRCEYCATAHGCHGSDPAVMSEDVMDRVVHYMAEHAPLDDEFDVEIGGGETFLAPRLLWSFLDRLDDLTAGTRGKAVIRITTNGTLLSRKTLGRCLARGIHLGFSIDGPQEFHDANRRDRTGRPTHEIAMTAWRAYREMTSAAPDGPDCTINSVISRTARLRDVHAFWMNEGVQTFEDTLLEPNPFDYGPDDLAAWRERREVYLEDLEVIALEQASRLTLETFEDLYRGPQSILSLWQDLHSGQVARPCGAGGDVIGIDCHGTIYPCDGFFGFPDLAIGDVSDGIDPARLGAFEKECVRTRSECARCAVGFLCDRGCPASHPDRGVLLNTFEGCEFMERTCDLIIRSYHALGT